MITGGWLFLPLLSIHHPRKTTFPRRKTPPINRAILVFSSIIRNVLSSNVEAELVALFHNVKKAESACMILADLGHLQPPTPIHIDNKCASGITNEIVKQRRSKAVDMRYYWVRYRIRQGHVHVHWSLGTENYADYFTKYFSNSHHRRVRDLYLLAKARHTVTLH